MKLDPLLPEPRSYVATAITIAAVTALPFALLFSWMFSMYVDRPMGEILLPGMAGGLVFGAFMGITLAAFLRGRRSQRGRSTSRPSWLA